jgi:hypothetical protein
MLALLEELASFDREDALHNDAAAALVAAIAE